MGDGVLPWGYVRAKTKNDLAGISALDIAEISLEASGALEVLSSEVRCIYIYLYVCL